MPGLRWCGRSWAVSADVIPVVAFLGLLFHLCWIVLVIILQFSLGSLQGCYATENSQQHLAVLCLLFSSFIATAMIEVALIVSGLQGTPLEVSKRRAVPILLSFQLALWISQLFIAGYGTWVVIALPLSYPADICWFRYRRQLILRILLFCSWGILFCNWLRVFVFYNLFPVADDLRSWARHLKAVSCFLGSPHIFRTFEERYGGEPQKELSIFYKGLLKGLDLTPTDQLTAVLLLNRLQSSQEGEGGHRSASQGLSLKDLQDGALLAKYALAAYCDKVDSARHSKISGEYEGISQTAGISKADVLYVNRRDALLGDLPYYVALDKPHQRVVIAFKGTCSLADMFTDAVALPKSGAVQWFSGREMDSSGSLHIHSGVLKAADAVWSDMTQIGLVHALDHPEETPPIREGTQAETSPYSKKAFHGTAAAVLKDHIIRRNWQLVTTGHSLGAGVAVLIAARLREVVADTYCWAFSPPGGFCGLDAAGMTREFCTSVVLNDDMVPRTSIQSTNGFLESLIIALSRCRFCSLRVLYLVVTRRLGRRSFDQIFKPLHDMPEEGRNILKRFHDASAALPPEMSMTMHPPGNLVLVRPSEQIDHAGIRWRIESVQASELVDKGIIVSKGMLFDHSMHKLAIALREAATQTRSEECEV